MCVTVPSSPSPRRQAQSQQPRRIHLVAGGSTVPTQHESIGTGVNESNVASSGERWTAVCKTRHVEWVTHSSPGCKHHSWKHCSSARVQGSIATYCIGLSQYIAITNLSIIAVFVEYFRQFLTDLNQIYRHSSVPKNTSPRIFLSFLSQAVSEHGAAATFFVMLSLSRCRESLDCLTLA